MNMVMIQEIESLPVDLRTPGWLWVSPESTTEWRAYQFIAQDGSKSCCFLGSGEMPLNFAGIKAGANELLCLNGYAYLATDTRISALPVFALGYEQVVQNEDLVALSNFGELLIVDGQGQVRYSRSLVSDYLEIVKLDSDAIWLKGVRKMGCDTSEMEEWTMRIEDLPLAADLLTFDRSPF